LGWILEYYYTGKFEKDERGSEILNLKSKKKSEIAARALESMQKERVGGLKKLSFAQIQQIVASANLRCPKPASSWCVRVDAC